MYVISVFPLGHSGIMIVVIVLVIDVMVGYVPHTEIYTSFIFSGNPVPSICTSYPPLIPPVLGDS